MPNDKRLAGYVSVFNEKTGETTTFGPSDKVPSWAEKLITNPAAWQQPPAEEDEDEVVLTSGVGSDGENAPNPREAEQPDGGDGDGSGDGAGSGDNGGDGGDGGDAAKKTTAPRK